MTGYLVGAKMTSKTIKIDETWYMAIELSELGKTIDFLLDIADDKGTQPAYRRGLYRGVEAIRRLAYSKIPAEKAIHHLIEDRKAWNRNLNPGKRDAGK